MIEAHNQPMILPMIHEQNKQHNPRPKHTRHRMGSPKFARGALEKRRHAVHAELALDGI
jgi:hypothetical protein